MKRRRLDLRGKNATRWLSLAGLLLFSSTAASANSEYYRHHIFDNSLTPDTYFYSVASSNGSSFIEQ